MEQDSLVTLNVERLKGTYGRITTVWEADGSISDVFPTSGVVRNLQNYRRVTSKLWLLLMPALWMKSLSLTMSALDSY